MPDSTSLADTLDARAGQIEHQLTVYEQNLASLRTMIDDERSKAKELRDAAVTLRGQG
jgi:hypothetical protein